MGVDIIEMHNEDDSLCEHITSRWGCSMEASDYTIWYIKCKFLLRLSHLTYFAQLNDHCLGN